MKDKLEEKILSNSKHWDGNDYRTISLPQCSINMAFLSEYNFYGNEIVLDIGCGDGTTTRKIAQMVQQGRVIGIDASESMIEVANQGIYYPNVCFKLLNAQQLNFSHEFDVVTCFFCMQWVIDKVTTFQSIYRSLKTQGKFLMIVPLPHSVLPKIRDELITEPQWEKYFRNYSDPLQYINDVYYEKYAKTAGLIIDSYRVDPTPITFISHESFFSFMCQMTPHISCLPTTEEKNIFMHELLEKYFKIHPMQSNGYCQLEYRLAKLCAYKLA